MDRESLCKLLAQTECCGIYRLPPDSREMLGEATKSLGYAYFEINLEEVGEMAPVLETFGQKLHFPEWYGANLDALSDCLTDFSWHESPGYVLAISGATALHAATDIFARINAVLSLAIEEWRVQGIPFWVVYDMCADDIPDLPVRI